MSALRDELLRPLTPEQEARLTDKQKMMRQFIRRRSLLVYIFGSVFFLAILIALAYTSFASHYPH
ncbi:hypothetical protein ACFO5W_05605 [Dyella halodurans]|uniref:DUF3094 family protein n=1 Tax=Dyella halodurans TaxID=1920171 RepID=A0ABV9BZR0_9GAMM|nr:hypothetical protein [Dyella halodurans]